MLGLLLASAASAGRLSQRSSLLASTIARSSHVKASSSPAQQTIDTIRRAQVFCFDVDSTVIAEEGIDRLAEFKGAGEKVAELTKKAMGGNVLFQDALADRLAIIQPSRSDLQRFLSEHPFHLTPGIREVISTLQAQGKIVYLVSGGFRQMIDPIASELDIPSHRVFANTLMFHPETGDFSGFDSEEPTSRDGGKAAVVKLLQEAHGYSSIVMVGDGVTDMQARPPADLFIGFGGVVVREKVKEGADWFVTDFKDLVDVLKH